MSEHEHGPLVDTCVRPYLRANAEIREYLPDVFSKRGMPDVESWWYQAPGGDHHASLYEAGPPGSDPQIVVRDVLGVGGADIAVLNPLTRGNLPDWRLNTAICAATNDWLAEVWLSSDPRLRGTIRVNPEDVPGAVAEIERWAAHPGMVQVGVPLQSREPYGKPQFLPIWEAAAGSGLPVAVQQTGGAGLEYAPTPAGHARTYPHYAAYHPLNGFVHLSTLIMDGAFDRFDDLVFVFADGGLDALAPLIWRLDDLWVALREQTPWVERYPHEYLSGHVRYCTSLLEGPTDAGVTAPWLEQLDKEGLQMFASSYPSWAWAGAADLPAGMTGPQLEKVRWRTADALYGLGLATAKATA
jgi:predicted TIM-barrel fold metal-dependent hydrolase